MKKKTIEILITIIAAIAAVLASFFPGRDR